MRKGCFEGRHIFCLPFLSICQSSSNQGCDLRTCVSDLFPRICSEKRTVTFDRFILFALCLYKVWHCRPNVVVVVPKLPRQTRGYLAQYSHTMILTTILCWGPWMLGLFTVCGTAATLAGFVISFLCLCHGKLEHPKGEGSFAMEFLE